MKKVIYLLYVLSSTLCLGQTSFSFDDSTTTWNVASTYPHATMQNPGFIETTTLTYGFKGDTVISSAVWRKMFYTADTNIFTSANLQRIGYVRQINNLVLFTDTLSNLDTIYNFNLHIGDSVRYNVCPQYPYIHISNIDSIIVDGSYRKRFFFAEPTGCPNSFTYLKEIWLEGIGSIHSPLNPLNPHLTSTEEPDTVNLTCYKQNDTVVWFNSDYGNCVTNIVLSIKDIITSSNNVTVYPHPVSHNSILSFSNQDSKKFCLDIYTIDGVKVKSFNTNGNSFNLLKQDFADGIYMYHLYNTKNSISIYNKIMFVN